MLSMIISQETNLINYSSMSLHVSNNRDEYSGLAKRLKKNELYNTIDVTPPSLQ